MKVGSLVVVVVALLGIICFLGNRGKLRSQQTESVPAPVVPSQPPVPVKQDGQEKSAESIIGPVGFPYSAQMPVEPVAPFKDKGFKVGVVAYLNGAELTNRVDSEVYFISGPPRNRITVSMGAEKRKVELDKSLRLVAVDQDASKELDAGKLSTILSKERCLLTLENRGGEEKITQICILKGELARSRDRKETIKNDEELQNLIYQWKVALVGDSRREHKMIKPEDVKRGKETIARAERRLMMNAMDCDGESFRFHTRGGVKSLDIENRKVTLAQGGQKRTWNVSREAKVVVVTIPLMWIPNAPNRWSDADWVEADPRSALSIRQATEGMARLRGDSQVYLTFNGKGTVERIDIMEQERLNIPDMPWLPFSMSDVKE